jgi:P27 family predicted phage terminase small subunit
VGKRGPAPMPTPLKVMHGERRPSRLNRSAPKPKGNLPTMPGDMSEQAQVVWKRQLEAMGATGILTAVDSDSLRAYCDAVVRYQQSAPMLESTGPLVRGARGNELVRSPLHQVVRDNAMLIRLFAKDLGFLPSAREGLHVKDDEDDPVANWLGEAGA